MQIIPTSTTQHDKVKGMSIEAHFMSASDALKFIEATKVRSSEFCLHLSVRTYVGADNPVPCSDYADARTWMDITRKQAIAAFHRLSKDDAEKHKIVRIGVSSRDDNSNRVTVWIG